MVRVPCLLNLDPDLVAMMRQLDPVMIGAAATVMNKGLEAHHNS